MSQHPLILALDVAGQPRRWITYEENCYYVCKGLIAWTLGEYDYTVWGGTQRTTGERSHLLMNTIVAIKGSKPLKKGNQIPALTNRALFRRDKNICAYCGNEFSAAKLTRDHIMPTSRGGKDTWTNVVAACGHCNRHKSNTTPEEAGMQLLYVPYAPNRAEYLILMNRNVLADQMDFLKKLVPQYSRIHS